MRAQVFPVMVFSTIPDSGRDSLMAPSFWTSFLPRRKKREPDPLPLQARVATLESEMLSLRELSDRHYTSLRKLSGKVYRGVALGDTVDAEQEAPPAVVEPVALSGAKAELYRRASELRRH